MKRILLCLLITILLIPVLSAQTIRYVKYGGKGNGSSWANASGNPQAMIDLSSSGDEVWVAAASYYGGIILKDGVSLYGGFAGTENDKSLRDWKNNICLIQADGKNVVTAENISGSTILDGFTISHYLASAYSRGMYSNNASPIIRNCTFSGNKSTANIISNNGYGAALYNENNSNPHIYDCVFSGNTSTSYAGAVYNLNSSPVFYDCSFVDNRAQNAAGVYNAQSSAAFYNCIFMNNQVITNNFTGAGGGMYNVSSSPLLINCLLVKNVASDNGAAIFNISSIPTIINCTISGNTADNNSLGGKTIYYFNVNPAVTATGSIINSIIWDNGSANVNTPDIFVSGGLLGPKVVNSIISDGQNGGIDTDPAFESSINNDYRLKPFSSAINAGINDSLPQNDTVDILGNPRVINGNVDLGAYETLVMNQIENNGDSIFQD